MSNTIIHRIKVKDLNADFIKKIQAEHRSDDAEIVFHIHPAIDDKRLTEKDFWDIISLLDWEKADDEAIVEPVVAHLATLPVGMIYQFEDKLSEKLYQLDQKVFAEQDNDNGYRKDNYFSVDIFLYARACVVANGQEVFQKVVNHPSEFPKDVTFEALLYVAVEAYKRKTGENMRYLRQYNYETFSNKVGWKKTPNTL